MMSSLCEPLSVFRVHSVIGHLLRTDHPDSYQIVVRFDPKQLPEVAEGQRGVRLEAEVRVVVRRRQIAPLAAARNRETIPTGNRDTGRYVREKALLTWP